MRNLRVFVKVLLTIAITNIILWTTACSTVSLEQEITSSLHQKPTAGGVNSIQPSWLFQKLTTQPASPQKTPPWVIRQQLLQVNTQYLPNAGEKFAIDNLDLNLFDDVTLRTEQIFRSDQGDTQIVWNGTIEHKPSSLITLVIENKRILGSVFDGQNYYQLEGLTNGWHKISQIDPSKMPQEQFKLVKELNEGSNKNYGKESTVDVMVVYSRDSKQAFPDIHQRIALALEQANASLIGSGINTKLRLVHMAQVDYVSKGLLDEDLTHLSSPKDKVIDQVHQWRNQFGADIVSLWVPSGNNACSHSYQMLDMLPQFESRAFNVVATNCASNGTTFTHAIGRNLGLAETQQSQSAQGVYDFSHALKQQSSVSLMGAGAKCGAQICTTIPYFSNPALTLGSSSFGTDQANNVATLQQTMSLTSGFRPSQKSTSNLVTNVVMASTPQSVYSVNFNSQQTLFNKPLNPKQQQELNTLKIALQQKHPNPKWIKRSRIVALDASRLPTSLSPQGQGQTSLSLNLFDDINITAKQTGLIFRGSQNSSWQGSIEDHPMSSINLVISGDDVMGLVQLSGRTFEIEPLSNNFHRISEIDSSLLPADHPAEKLKNISDAAEADASSNGSYISSSQAATESATGMIGSEPIIDMMIVYEKRSKDYYEDGLYGSYYWPQKLQLQVDVLNTVLSYSQAIPRVRLAKVHEVNHTSSNNSSTEIYRLYNSTDGYMDEVHDIRQQYGIDIVSMIMHTMDGDYCGRGYRPTDLADAGNFRLGFNVVSRNCMSGLTFAHEFGHNLGMNHDAMVAGTCSNNNYSNQQHCQENNGVWTLDTGIVANNFGYTDKENTFRTVMSYNTECDNAGLYCNRIFFFSSPIVSTNDYIPVGVETTDNANTINSTYSTIQAYKEEPNSQFSQVNVAGSFNEWSANADNGQLTYQGHLKWQGDVDFARGTNLLKFATNSSFDNAWGQTDASISPATEAQLFHGLAEAGGGDILVNVTHCGTYSVTFFESGMYSVELKQKNNTSTCQDDWRRTIIFIQGDTIAGQDMFIRGGIDHNYATKQLGKECAGSGVSASINNSKDCAISIRHNNLLNETTYKWKIGENYLDWYGKESSQGKEFIPQAPYLIEHSNDAEGTALDWSTNVWPSDWGPKKTVSTDGFGETIFNIWGNHYWMLDIEMNCSEAIPDENGNRWFELKSYISNGPGWEADVAQAGAPYVSGNHFAQCGKINMFQRGSSEYQVNDF